MKQQLHFVTFATADLDAARRFYRDALGWTPLMDVEGEIIFFQVAPGMLLGLFDASKFTQDLATGTEMSRVSGVSLSHNVDSAPDVKDLTRSMTAAGGTVLKSPQASESAFSTPMSKIPMGLSGRSLTTQAGTSMTPEPSPSAENYAQERSGHGSARQVDRMRPTMGPLTV